MDDLAIFCRHALIRRMRRIVQAFLDGRPFVSRAIFIPILHTIPYPAIPAHPIGSRPGDINNIGTSLVTPEQPYAFVTGKIIRSAMVTSCQDNLLSDVLEDNPPICHTPISGVLIDILMDILLNLCIRGVSVIFFHAHDNGLCGMGVQKLITILQYFLQIQIAPVF